MEGSFTTLKVNSQIKGYKMFDHDMIEPIKITKSPPMTMKHQRKFKIHGSITVLILIILIIIESVYWYEVTQLTFDGCCGFIRDTRSTQIGDVIPGSPIECNLENIDDIGFSKTSNNICNVINSDIICNTYINGNITTCMNNGGYTFNDLCGINEINDAIHFYKKAHILAYSVIIYIFLIAGLIVHTSYIIFTNKCIGSSRDCAFILFIGGICEFSVVVLFYSIQLGHMLNKRFYGYTIDNKSEYSTYFSQNCANNNFPYIINDESMYDIRNLGIIRVIFSIILILFIIENMYITNIIWNDIKQSYQKIQNNVEMISGNIQQKNVKPTPR